MRDGKPYTVTGDRALAIWVCKTLHTACERFQYTAWSHDYGNELGALIGYAGDRGILESLLGRAIREALLVSLYLTAVGDWLTAVCADRGVARLEGESDQQLRERTLEKLGSNPTSGNADHYKQWCTALPGILQARVFPLRRCPGGVPPRPASTGRGPRPGPGRPVLLGAAGGGVGIN